MTEDTLFDGNLRILQPEKGYRFSVDAVLLASFVSPRAGDRILDLGAGCGIISLILAYRYSAVNLTALELQTGLFRLLERNVELNHFAGRLCALQGDVQEIRERIRAESFDLVLSNPPYRTLASGRQNPEDEEAIARHELRVDLDGVLAAASYAVRNRGRTAIIYPAQRLAELLRKMGRNSLEPKRMQTVHSYPGAPARMVLLEAVKNGGEELQILPPLFIYREKGGEYSLEMSELYGGRRP